MFLKNLVYVCTEEAHLINEWGAAFRKDFRSIGKFFRGCLSSNISAFATTATLTPGEATTSVCKSLGFTTGSFHLIRHSNKHPNMQIAMKPLTTSISGSTFPDLLPILSSGRKAVIHCDTLDLIFRVFVYLMSLYPRDSDFLRRVRPYTSICPDEFNLRTLYLFKNDPYCQIVIGTVAIAWGLNVATLLDNVRISLLKGKSLDQVVQEWGRVGRHGDFYSHGIVLYPKRAIKAAEKILKEAESTADTGRRQLLTEKIGYNRLLNQHYQNKPEEDTIKTCIEAKRKVPCSLCQTLASNVVEFTSPIHPSHLPPLTPFPSSSPWLKSTLSLRKKKISPQKREEYTSRLTPQTTPQNSWRYNRHRQ
ncbi:hypothetical protein PQX77_019736 [Marasmius sp. AFHP31]|nr:hypothetical protein PQX77_019736 [Marasmius sp. AFHP31]